MADPGQPPAKDQPEDSGAEDRASSPGEVSPPKAAEPTRIYNTDTQDGFSELPPLPGADQTSIVPPKHLGKYTIEACIGQGGMGVVWKALDPDLNRSVAIKVLAPHLAQSRTARQRFQREARAAAAISHPHVLTIHSVEGQDQTAFLVMEYVAGGSLKEYVSERGKLSPLQAIQLSCQIAQGLAAAHAQGVIHRDVKPGNVMLHEGGVRVRLADFGLARAAFDNSELTSHDQAVGTPAYMAPEQLRGDNIDARADLFSLGCVMHYMLVGHSPFQGRTQAETIHKILGEVPRPLLEIDPAIPPALAEIVDRLLRKDPDERYQSAFEVAAVLERFLMLLNQAPTDEIASILARPGLGSTPRAGHKRSQPGRRRVVTALGAVLGLAALAIALGLKFGPALTSSGDSPAAGGAGSGSSTQSDGSTSGAPLHTPQILTVARDGDAGFRTVEEALAAARDGDTVRVIDNSTYAVNLRLHDRQHLVLETTGGAQLVAKSSSDPVIEARGGKDIQILGFRITTTGTEQHAILLAECEAVRLERLMIRQEGAQRVAAIHIADCNARPGTGLLVVANCRVETLSTGQCLWVSADPQPVWNLQIENNRFQGPRSGTLAALMLRGGSVQIQNNVFDGGHVGLNLNLMSPTDPTAAPPGLQVANNTFFDCVSWIGLIYTVPEKTPFTLVNNLILKCDGVEASPEQQRALAGFGEVLGNIWERASPAPGESEDLQRWARFEPTVTVLSRDRADDHFLHLPDDSPLRAAGAGGESGEHAGHHP